MSHFSVLCIGNVENNMRPFNEQDEDFFAYNDRTEKFLADYENHCKDERFLKEYPNGTSADFARWWNESDVIVGDSEDIPENSFLRVGKDGKVIEYMAWFNPNGNYDYYGDGYDAFLLKDGSRCFTARKKDIDIEGMKAEKEKSAREEYRKVRLAIPTFEEGAFSWNDIMAKVKEGELTADEAGEKYRSQECVKRFEMCRTQIFGGGWLGWGFDITDYNCTEDEYVARHTDSLCYAVVENGCWHERGKMGWWGISIDDAPLDVWRANVWKAIENAKEYDVLTMLDCHI